MSYLSIDNYGLIGDMHTAALVGLNGAIDWLCLPRFDSPSVFAALIDDQKGGSFHLAPIDHEQVSCKQLYWPDTNVLITRFFTSGGAAELIDFMPVSDQEHRQVIRRVIGVRGSIHFKMICQPAFNYARDCHEVEICREGAIFKSKTLNLGLTTTVELSQENDYLTATFLLSEGERQTFVLEDLGSNSVCRTCLDEDESEILFRQTIDYWRDWLSQCTYTGRWQEMVHRSALTLKLMTYAPTGAIIAAPTCGLPEAIGGERNWDYRYTWIRDSAFSLYALLRLGFKQEAGSYMRFLTSICIEEDSDPPLQIMYTIDGHKHLDEEILDHLDGYMGSKPVRIGNGAYNQLQLDIYGEILDAAYLYDKHGSPISVELWQSLRNLVNWVCDHWHLQDSGIWEVRNEKRNFVYSKLMCWVALDRGLRISHRRSFPADRERWALIRDKIFEDIQTKGWNEQRQAYVQAYGSQTLDAANLMMSLTLFLSPTDPRFLSMLKAMMKSPRNQGLLANSLVYRYNLQETADGLTGHEGTFNICTFWLVEALTRAGRFDQPQYLDQARLIFERMLGFANHLGLYAEETGVCGESLGNYPQAFTHLALISAAYNLNRSL